MKKPVKNPPQAEEVATKSAAASSVPSIEVSSSSNEATASSDTAPTLTPPASSSGSSEDSFGAVGVWNNDKRINALFGANETRNSWVGVVGVGWVKFASTIDSANQAFTILASAAKIKNSPVNYNLDGGVITEMYVW